VEARKWSPSAFGGPEVLREVTARVPDPKPGQVTIDVRAVGVNHADYRHFAAGPRRKHLGSSIGFEAAGVLSAVGPDTEIASGGGPPATRSSRSSSRTG
jgi:NADPH:quinone reductase